MQPLLNFWTVVSLHVGTARFKTRLTRQSAGRENQHKLQKYFPYKLTRTQSNSVDIDTWLLSDIARAF